MEIYLRVIPDPCLKQHSTEVKEITSTEKIILARMEEIMKSHRGKGLAANQVGVLLRLVVFKDEKGVIHKLINPVIISHEGEMTCTEGCLSLPGERYQVKRFNRVSVEALNKKGKTVRMDLEGLDAACIQHEIDHLNGILLTDKIKYNE